MLFTKMASHCLLYYTEQVKWPHGENLEFLNFQIGGTNSKHCDPKH